jgi:aldehyde:ferredoxin oxidoreductase
MGKILRVNLSAGTLTVIQTQPYAEKYLGGRGIASGLYWEISGPGIKAFDPANPLIFMTGPLVASSARAANIMAVVGKSPAAFPESYSFGNISGNVAAELKKAGFDGIVVEGKAERPVYLWINDGKAEILDASSLWGQGAYRTVQMLQQCHGEDLRFITTGVAGERKVRTAIALASHESALSCGFGAVMGSKNLKAIAIKGTGKVSVADPEKLKELNLYTARIDHRIQFPFPPGVMDLGESGAIKIVDGGGCHLCGAKKCIRNRYRCSNGSEAVRHCEHMQCYIPRYYGVTDEPIETVFEAPGLVNDYSIDAFELHGIVDWLYACHKAGVFTESETGLPLSEIGRRVFLEKLLHSIAYREGFGDILAEGLARAAGLVKKEAGDLIPRTAAPIGMYDPMPLNVTQCLMHPMEPRVYHSWDNDQGYPFYAWFFNQIHVNDSPVTTGVFKNIAKAFWGGEEAADLTSYAGKARAAILIQDRACLKDSLGLCSFTWPIAYSLATPGHVGDPDLEAKIYSAVTGRDSQDLNKYGEVISNIQRMILIREGRKLPEDDYLREYLFDEPISPSPDHPVAIAPGPGETVVDMTGRKLDREKYLQVLKEYYQLRGWDTETGIPLSGTLKSLGLEDAAGLPGSSG